MITELNAKERRGNLLYKVSLIAAFLLYVSIFLSAFENHPLLAVCVTLCLALSIRFVLLTHDIKIERRALLGAKEKMANGESEANKNPSGLLPIPD